VPQRSWIGSYNVDEDELARVLSWAFMNLPCLGRRQNRIAKVRVAASNPVVRSKEMLVEGL
jgi:hypothetical protein